MTDQQGQCNHVQLVSEWTHGLSNPMIR